MNCIGIFFSYKFMCLLQVTLTWDWRWEQLKQTTKEDCPVLGWMVLSTTGVSYSSAITSDMTIPTSCRCFCERRQASLLCGTLPMPPLGSHFKNHRASMFHAQNRNTRCCTWIADGFNILGNPIPTKSHFIILICLGSVSYSTLQRTQREEASHVLWAGVGFNNTITAVLQFIYV